MTAAGEGTDSGGGGDGGSGGGPNAYGERQRELRLARRLSVRQLAELAGLAFGYLARVERGDDAPPGEAAILKIAGALGVPEDELLHLARRPHPEVLRAVTDLPPEGRLFLRRAADRRLTPAEWRQLADMLDRPEAGEDEVPR